MNKHKKRTGYSFTIEDGEAVITLIKPLSGEYKDRYFVIYEDAFGNYSMEPLSITVISDRYKIDINDIENAV